ncbi:hypothetical protein [Paractinoplanes toevensis]|uniref:Uncharacterized protein n=1 Tax=Paractinoplanes toevensis TaxID=571911 RepID=A0A919W3D9_9ACTN|nr:hypothetical protein [Actinoplanes toevensis]GIM90425.1 hypothetical protein Ato02nite_022180 [Actinoplanes toevensis]
MTLVECALWGLFGGFAVEGLELSAVIRRTGRFPWKRRGGPGLAPFLVSVIIRFGVGAGLAAAVGSTGSTSPLSALAVGVAAPLIIEKLAQQIPVEPAPAIETRSAATKASGNQPRARPGAIDAS